MSVIVPGRTLYQVRGGYLGVADGAALPSAAGKNPGDYYVINVAGGGYAVGDLAIVNASSSGYDKLTPAASYALKDGSDFTAPATWRTRMDVPTTLDSARKGVPDGGGATFDGAATTTRIAAQLVGQTLGTGEITEWIRFFAPTTNPTSSVYLSQIQEDVNNGLKLSVNGSGSLIMTTRAAGSSVDTTLVTTFVATYAGQIVDVTLVRSQGGGTITGYVNGVQVYTGSPAGASVSYTSAATFVVGNQDSASRSYQGAMFRAVLFNRALSAADVASLVVNGVRPADQGSTTANTISGTTLNGGFETLGGGGADVFGSWNEFTSGTGVIAAVTGANANSGTNAVSLARTVAGDTCLVQQNITLMAGKRYRSSFYGKTPATGSIQVYHVPNVASSIVTALTATYTQYTVEFVAESNTTGNFQINMNPGSTGTCYIDDVSVQRIGAIIDLDLFPGVGTFFPDRSSSVLNADAYGGVGHLLPKTYGSMSVFRYLLHSDISSTAGTTKVMDLPPNSGVTIVELDRIAGMDAGITMDVGISGTPAKYASALAAASSGIVGGMSLSLISESNSANTAVYIKKSGATTAGALKVRINYTIRG